jgi:hypothetical protein
VRCGITDLAHNASMAIPQEDEGRLSDESTPQRDEDNDGIVEDGLGHPAAAEDDAGGD